MTGGDSGLLRGLRRIGGALAVLLVFGAAARAEPSPAQVPAEGRPTKAPPSKTPPPKSRATGSPDLGRPDLFVGFSYAHSGEANLTGAHISASYPFWDSLRLVGDVSGHFGSFAGADLSQTQVMVGARKFWPQGSILPYGQFLLGVVRHGLSVPGLDGELSETNTDLAVAPGIGADFRLTRKLAIRAAVDLVILRASGGFDADPRLSVGGVYRFAVR